MGQFLFDHFTGLLYCYVMWCIFTYWLLDWLSITDMNSYNTVWFTSILLTYEGRLKSSWTRIITPSRNFVEVRWRSLFISTSLGKRRTSYNAPPTSRKRVADRLPQASGGYWNRRFWPLDQFGISSKTLPLLENRSSSHRIVSIGFIDEL
jgi:hypothetical protein